MSQGIIISGPTSGLGFELLRALSGKNWPLILVGRNLDRTRLLFGPGSVSVKEVEFDLSSCLSGEKVDCLQNLVFSALEHVNVDRLIFVNNAGVIEPIGKIGQVVPSTLLQSMAVNFGAAVAISSAAVNYVKNKDICLHILNITSGAAVRPIPGWAAYCSAKAATRHFFDVLSLEYQQSVTLDHFDPGTVDTKMQKVIRDATPELFPSVIDFHAFKNNGFLKSPKTVAKELMARIESWGG